MRTELYREEDLQILRHRLVRCRLGCVLFVTVAFTVAIGLCFLVHDGNAALLRAVNVILTSLGVCASLYIGVEEIRPRRARIRYLTRMLTAPRHFVAGTLQDTGRIVTIAPAVTARVLDLTDDGGETFSLRWDTACPCPPLSGVRVVLGAVQSTVVAWEVSP